MRKFVKLVCSNPTKECGMEIYRETTKPPDPILCPACKLDGREVKMIEEYEKGECVPKIYYFEEKKYGKKNG